MADQVMNNKNKNIDQERNAPRANPVADQLMMEEDLPNFSDK